MEGGAGAVDSSVRVGILLLGYSTAENPHLAKQAIIEGHLGGSSTSEHRWSGLLHQLLTWLAHLEGGGGDC